MQAFKSDAQLPKPPCALWKKSQCPALGGTALSKSKLGAFLLNSALLCLCPSWVKL